MLFFILTSLFDKVSTSNFRMSKTQCVIFFVFIGVIDLKFEGLEYVWFAALVENNKMFEW